MFGFGKKKEKEILSKKDCDSQFAVANLLNKMESRGVKVTLNNLEAFIPGITDYVNNTVDNFVKENYEKGINREHLVNHLIPEKEKEILKEKAIPALLVFQMKCKEYKTEQNGGVKKTLKKKTLKKKTLKKK